MVTVDKLIARLQAFQEAGFGDVEIRLAADVAWPKEHDLGEPAVAQFDWNEESGRPEPKPLVYFPEGGFVRLLPQEARNALNGIEYRGW